ncbi:hypothetical protein POF50_017990, partial [Streptomyces sp. SL13]|nr:hypothetical protein [Streptantibioticus silvisoli]
MPDEAIRTRQSSGTRAGTGPAPAAAPRHRRRSFAHRGESVAEARRFADETLAGWGVTDRLDDMRLCLSEIATNAVVHVAPPAVGGAAAVGAVGVVGAVGG